MLKDNPARTGDENCSPEPIKSLFDVDADIDQRKEALIDIKTNLPPFDIWLLMPEEERELYNNGEKKWRAQ